MKPNYTWYIPGTVLILLGVLIVAVPKLLIVLVASFVIMMGIAALYAGHLIRKHRFFIHGYKPSDPDTGFVNLRFARAPLYRSSYRW